MFIHTNEMRMKTTHHSFFCFTQKCGAEIRKKLRLLFLLESQSGLFPGFGLLLLDCVYLYGNGDVWASLSGWYGGGGGGDSVCEEHSLPNRGSVKTMVWLKSFETESLLQVPKTWSKTCAQRLFIWPLHLVWEKCGLVHWQRELVQCALFIYDHCIWCEKNVAWCTSNGNQCNALFIYDHRIWCEKNVVLCTANVNQCNNAHTWRRSTPWVDGNSIFLVFKFLK